LFKAIDVPFIRAIPLWFGLTCFYFLKEVYPMKPLFHMIAGAPDPVAPFSHAVECDGWVFVTGQMPFTETSIDSPYPEGIEAQTHAVMTNLKRVLAGCGLDLSHVVCTRVFLTRFDEDYDKMNAVYRTYFAAGRFPARTCIGVTGLAKNARVEIDFIARREEPV
jgi:reactive intermediate/imine deaminase